MGVARYKYSTRGYEGQLKQTVIICELVRFEVDIKQKKSVTLVMEKNHDHHLTPIPGKRWILTFSISHRYNNKF